ncbi:hypothetical protein HK102_005820, partial [Quaeritorhiza haematococci]
MPRIVELDDEPLRDLEYYFSRKYTQRRRNSERTRTGNHHPYTPTSPTPPPKARPAHSPAARARTPPPAPVPPIPSELSATTVPVLRPGVLTDTLPLAISQRLTNLLIVTPAKSIAYVQIFQSFANPGLVSSGRKYARGVWTLNGEPVAHCSAPSRRSASLSFAACTTRGTPNSSRQHDGASRRSRIRDIERFLRARLSK